MGFMCTTTNLTFKHVQGKANKSIYALSRQLHNPKMTSKQACSHSSSDKENEQNIQVQQVYNKTELDK